MRTSFVKQCGAPEGFQVVNDLCTNSTNTEPVVDNKFIEHLYCGLDSMPETANSNTAELWMSAPPNSCAET